MSIFDPLSRGGIAKRGGGSFLYPLRGRGRWNREVASILSPPLQRGHREAKGWLYSLTPSSEGDDVIGGWRVEGASRSVAHPFTPSSEGASRSEGVAVPIPPPLQRGTM